MGDVFISFPWGIDYHMVQHLAMLVLKIDVVAAWTSFNKVLLTCRIRSRSSGQQNEQNHFYQAPGKFFNKLKFK
jgi:hypothetical protein